MNSLSDIFEDFDKVVSGDIEIVCNKPTLILAMTARTGSTQLCSVLKSMKIFGNPCEIFNTRGVVQHNVKINGARTFVDYIHKLTSTEAPFFSIKTSWNDFEIVSCAYQKIFPQARFFYLDRFDIVAQAFSLYKAIKTDRWHSRNESEQLNDIQALSVDQFDVKHVQLLMKELVREKFQWENFFFAHRLVVPHIYYELIKNDWPAAANIIARAFDVHSVECGGGEFRRLSDEADEQLINQFKNIYGYSWSSV